MQSLHIPAVCLLLSHRLSYFLKSVRLDGNMLTGQIPMSIALSRGLSMVSLVDNPMSCSSRDGKNNSKVCQSQDLLPCFLQLTPVLLPRPDASYMECPMISRKSTADIIRDCRVSGAMQVVCLCLLLSGLLSMNVCTSLHARQQALDLFKDTTKRHGCIK